VHPELQVVVHKLGNRYLAVTKGPNGGEILRNEFQHETMHLTYLGPLWLVDQESLVPEEKRRLADILRGRASLTQVASQGQRLYQYLFGSGPDLRRYLAQHEDSAPHQLTLVFTPGAAHLARQPWEYIFDGRAFPCLTGELLLSRRPSTTPPLEALDAAQAPLRILAVIAAPTDQVPINTAAELEILHSALAEPIANGKLVLGILPEPTSAALLDCTAAETYHIVHYVGHATYHLPQHRGFLCFENDIGQTELLSGSQLPRFIKGRPPGLLTLSACRRSQVGVFDAFQSVATELMDFEMPGVMIVPVGMEPLTAIEVYRALYGDIAHGLTVQESLQRSRTAVQKIDRASDNEGARYAWGVPALYQRVSSITLVSPDGEAPSQADVPAATPRPLPLVGRARELQAVRKAFNDGAGIFYILGGQGIGKHAFTAYVARSLVAGSAAALTVRCREEHNPLTVLAKIADFWRTCFPDAGSQAADLLLDAHQDPFERARRAHHLLERKRYLLIFEDLDAWFGTSPYGHGRLRSETLSQILLGIFNDPSRAGCFITSGSRWTDLDRIDLKRRREIQLPLLSLNHATQIMNLLPTLRAEAANSAAKRTIYANLGGHPQALQILDRWLMAGNSLASLEPWEPSGVGSPEAWVRFLTEDILSQRDPGELDVLRALAVLTVPFSHETIASLTHVTSQHTGPLIEDWLLFCLIEALPGDTDSPIYRLTESVRLAILEGVSGDELASLHSQAAAHYAAPYYDAARRQVLSRNITTWAVDRIGWLARDASGILGMRLREARNPDDKAHLLSSAYAWQYHLVRAGDVGAATQIAQTIAPILDQLGQHDLSRELLQETLKPGEDVANTGNEVESFVRLQLEEGPLSTALDVYEDVYEALDPDQAGVQRAYVLLRAGSVKQRLGNAKAAIRDFTEALQIARDGESREAEAECLYMLATAHRKDGNLRQGLVCSQAARELYEALAYPSNLAVVVREQGLILEQMDRPERALQRIAAGLKIYRELGDQRGIADCLSDIGRLFEKLGKTEMAIRVIEEAAQHYEYLKDPEHVEVLSLLEDLYAHRQRLEDAVTRLRASRQSL